MKRITNLIGILMTIIVFISCELTTSTENKNIDEHKFSLENYLTKDGYVRLELKKMPSGHLHLFGQLNGVDGNFILDTGAGGTVIEVKNKAKFHLQSEKSDDQCATGVGGTVMQMQTSDNNNLKIAELELNELRLRLMNLDHVNNAFESAGLEKIDGVIGADILTNKKAIIDYSNLILYLKK
jgi:hypothetical protein